MKKLIPYITAFALSFTAYDTASAGSESRLDLSSSKFALKNALKQTKRERAQIEKDLMNNYLGCVERIKNNVRAKVIALNKTPDEQWLQRGAEKKCVSLKPKSN